MEPQNKESGFDDPENPPTQATSFEAAFRSAPISAEGLREFAEHIWKAAKAVTLQTIPFENLHAEYLQWVSATFPDETVTEQFIHLKEEFAELEAEQTKADEYADVLMLL